MARRTRTGHRAAPRGLNAAPHALAHIAALIDDGGQITIGAIPPIACAAIATADADCLAMLQRRPGEDLHALLARLDAAIATAWNERTLIDEINAPRPSRRP